MKFHRIILGISLLLISTQNYGQNRESLEAERKQIQNEIESTSKYIKRTDKKINTTLENYQLLASQIENRQALIDNIEAEIDSSQASIDLLEENMDSLNALINSLEIEYKNAIRKSYILGLTQNRLVQLFSSKTLEEAYKQWIFSKQYRNYLTKQKLTLEKINESLDSLYFSEEKVNRELQSLLTNKLQETDNLNQELESKDLLLLNLEKEQARLKIDLIAKQKKQKLISIEIERIILAELEKAKAAGDESEVDEVLSDSFIKNKLRLPKPVKSGVIISRYGKQKHPANPALVIENNGIDIKATKGASVHAVFEGEVVGDTFIPGVGNMLIIRHGNFYTVYSKLTRVFVKLADKVGINQRIAEVDEILHFEVWKGKEKQNPSLWIKK